VRTLVGGDLFDFGDSDGHGNDVRLQHPLGLTRWNDKLLIADTYNHKIKLLDPAARTVKSFAGTGKPGQADGGTPSFYEPGGLTLAGDKLYVADTNNHAIRVVDLKTKQTKTLAIKGLQPPPVNQPATTETAVNQEEIKLPLQKIGSADGSILLNLQLPAGYHLNPSAPHRYSVSVSDGSQLISIDSNNASGTLKNVQLPVQIPFHVTGQGTAQVNASFSFVYCREDNTGVCRIKTLKWQAPIEVTSDAGAATQVILTAKVAAE